MMPYLFRWETHDHRQVEWERPTKSDGSTDFRGSTGFFSIPEPEGLIPQYKQTSNHKTLPDFIRCASQSHLIVSTAARSILEDVEPNGHLFFDVELELKGGRVLTEDYHWWKCRNPLKGCIDIENSDVSVHTTRKGKISGLRPKKYGGIKVFWRRACISNRHMWVDQDLPDYVFISDEVADRFRSAGLTHLDLVEGGVSE